MWCLLWFVLWCFVYCLGVFCFVWWVGVGVVWFVVGLGVFGFGFSCFRCVWVIMIDLFGFCVCGLLLFCLVVDTWDGFGVGLLL